MLKCYLSVLTPELIHWLLCHYSYRYMHVINVFASCICRQNLGITRIKLPTTGFFFSTEFSHQLRPYNQRVERLHDRTKSSLSTVRSESWIWFWDRTIGPNRMIFLQYFNLVGQNFLRSHEDAMCLLYLAASVAYTCCLMIRAVFLLECRRRNFVETTRQLVLSYSCTIVG